MNINKSFFPIRKVIQNSFFIPKNQLNSNKINLIPKNKTVIIFKKIFKISILIFLFIFIAIFNIYNYIYLNKKYEIYFKYEDYEKNIITNKIKKYSGWEITEREANFINGIIRKKKLKKCLEIGVSNGGSSILILNALKDIDDYFLVSLDLNTQLYKDPNKKTGYRVNKFFPELNYKWKLYTGDQPHKFLTQLNIKFDFLFLDTRHTSPGEIINFIEALPFLNENAIVIIHDILWHFSKGSRIHKKIFPSCINLLPAIYGNKVLLGYNDSKIYNIGAVILYSHQENHYLDYFLLLLNFWEYMPTDKEINDLKNFIINYYKKSIYVKIFERAVSYNKNFIELLNSNYKGANAQI